MNKPILLVMRLCMTFGAFGAWLALAGCCGGPAGPRDAAATTRPQPHSQAALDARLRQFEYVQPKMGTGFRIVIYAPDQATADRASAAAWARVDELNGILSDYDPNSELSRLSQLTNEGPMPAPVKVSDDLWRVLEQSLEAARRSDGAFDVTIGPCVRLWRRSRSLGQLPTPERLAEARRSVGYRFLKLDPQVRTVQLLAAKMRLDVGGIAKGYTAEQCLATMRRLGIDRAMVGAAGDLAVGEPPPGRPSWRVAIQSLANPDKTADYVQLSRFAISTSGDTERFVEIGGVRYSHILDPVTGLGLARRIGVSVVAPDGTTADWMATALSVMGPEKGLAMVEQVPGAAARIETLDGDRVVVVESSRFKDFLSR